MSFLKKMTQEEYERRSERHGAIWWIGRILALTLVIGTFAILTWRLVSTIVPADMKTVVPNDVLCQAKADADAAGRELTVYYNELDNITRGENNYAYFSVSNVLFIEEAHQVQLTFRYNNSTIKHLKEDYRLPTMPDRVSDLYDVTLYVAYDLTPGDPTDNDGNDPASVRFERYHATSVASDATTMYNYRRLVFDGVDMTVTDQPVLAVYVDVYYVGDIHYDEGDPYGTLIIYDYAAERKPYKWTSRDLRAMEAFAS